MARPAARRARGHPPRLGQRSDRPAHEHARVLAVLAVDRDVGALGGRRRHCGAHGLRRDGERARGADDDGDVLGPLHAALVPELDPEGGAHRADRHADAVVHASPARRGRLRARIWASRSPGCCCSRACCCSSSSSTASCTGCGPSRSQRSSPPQDGRRSRTACGSPPIRTLRTSSPRITRQPRSPIIVARSRQAGSIQAIHGKGLMSFAQEHDCLLVLPHAVGDFVPEGATLIQAYGGGPFEAERRGASGRPSSRSGSSARSSRIRRSRSG